MALLIDTQVLVWLLLDNPRLSRAAVEAIQDPDQPIFISSVTAFEFVDLNRRGRFGADLSFPRVVEQLAATLLAFPAAGWTMVDALPDLHHDPIDRMLIAHAIDADLALLTADKIMRRYPVRSVW